MSWNSLSNDEYPTQDDVEDAVSQGDLEWSGTPPSLPSNRHWIRSEYEQYINHDDDPVNGLPSANLAANQHITKQQMLLFAEFTPDAPTLVVTGEGDGFVSLSWDAPQEAPDSELFRSTTDKSEPDPSDSIQTFENEDSTYTDNNVNNFTTYYYWVAISGPGGTSDFSNRVEATPFVTTQPPTAPEFELSYSASDFMSACNDTSTQTYYLDDNFCEELEVGCTLYTDDSFLGTADDGYYSDGTNWYQVDFGTIVATGDCVI